MAFFLGIIMQAREIMHSFCIATNFWKVIYKLDLHYNGFELKKMAYSENSAFLRIYTKKLNVG